MLELDVHLTKDGQVVVCHDANLNRISHSASLIPGDYQYSNVKQILHSASLILGDYQYSNVKHILHSASLIPGDYQYSNGKSYTQPASYWVTTNTVMENLTNMVVTGWLPYGKRFLLFTWDKNVLNQK